MSKGIVCVFALVVSGLAVLIYLLCMSRQVISTREVYKNTPQGELFLDIYQPRKKSPEKRPAILLFFGGGWVEGSVKQFAWFGPYFARQGIVAVAVDYRVDSRHHTGPDAAVADGFDALAWLHDNAERLGVDVAHIAASGGSAGGHIAACLAVSSPPEVMISAQERPKALLLLNPVLDLFNVSAELEFSPRELSLIEELTPDMRQALSPQQNVHSGIPSNLVLYGDRDPLVTQGDAWRDALVAHGVSVQYQVAPEQKHGFFNWKPWRKATAELMVAYLGDLGWLGQSVDSSPARHSSNDWLTR